MTNNDVRLHILIPGLIGLICLLGVIVLPVVGKPVPDVLTALLVAFGAWAFGAGAIKATTAAPEVKGAKPEEQGHE